MGQLWEEIQDMQRKDSTPFPGLWLSRRTSHVSVNRRQRAPDCKGLGRT